MIRKFYEDECEDKDEREDERDKDEREEDGT